MRSPILARLFTPVARPAALVFLSTLVLPSLHAALENGEVAVNNEPVATGETVLATDIIDLAVTDFPIGSGSLNGTMDDFSLNASGSITDEPFSNFTIASSLVEFVDDIVVNAEGVAQGTQLIVEIAWNVSGNTQTNSPQNVPVFSRIQLQAEGVDLDPDPQAPPPARQVWTRQESNVVPDIMDSLGQVKFEFLVEAGNPGSIRMRSVAGIQCGPASFGQQFLSTSSAGLNVDFVGATNVRTTEGQTIFRWDVNALSALDYGARDDDPPSDPVLTVGPSAGGPAFVNLSWDSVVGEFYVVQTTTDTATWTTVTEVLGTGNTVDIDLFADDAVVDHRLLPDIGPGTPDPLLVTPVLRIFRIDDGGPLVRVAWQTHHWELYSLNELNSVGTPNEVQSASGDGGVVWFDFTPVAPGQIFQVSALLK